MTAFRRFLSLASATALAAAVFLGARPASAVNYAVSVGINTYKSGYATSLTGSVPDAQHMTNLVTSRGQWDADKVTLLTNSGASLTNIRKAISNCAAKAVSGDKFLYYHSSHGGNYNTYYTTTNGDKYLHYSLNTSGEGHIICSYNADYTAKMMATDLAAFKSGVEIVVMLDTCHSAGMFKYAASTSSKNARLVEGAGDEIAEGADADNLAAGFFMQAVLAQLSEIEEDQIQRGLRPRSSRALASNVGWIAAADYDQYSWDGDTGGAFTEAFINGVTNKNKMCDNATYGNQDGYASFYEGWNYAKDIARGQRNYDAWQWDDDYNEYDYVWTDAQCANTNVLKSVLVGWAGKDAPNVAPAFSSSTATADGYKGDTIYFDFSTLLTAGLPAPTYTITSSVSSGLWEAADEILEFTPAATGTYTFTCTAANSIGSATCTLTVTVTEPPPATPEVPSTPPSASTTSFTATWSAVSDAASYNLYVEQKVAASTSARAATTILSEDFSHFTATGSSYSSSTASQTVDSGTWSYENVILTPNGAASGSGSAGFAQLKASAGYLYLPAVDNPSSLSVVAHASAGALTLEQKVSGTWTEIDSWTLASTGTEYTHDFSNAGSAVELRFAAGSKATYIHDVTITGDSANWVPVTGYYPVSVSGTSKAVSGLFSGTEYRYSVAAVNAAGVESDPSPYVTVETAEGDTAPSWSASFPATAAVTVGQDYEILAVSSYASGSPAPTVTMTSTCADGDFDNDYFLFNTATPGTYTFTFTAANGISPDAVATLTLTASAAPVTVPTLLVGDETATTAYATWDECTGVSSYTLQLASDDQFTTGGSGGEVTLFSNDATDPSAAPDGWTYNLHNTSGSYLQLMSGNYVVTEAFDASACTDLTLSLYMRTYGGTIYPSVTVEYSTDGGTTWSEPLGTLSAANTTMAERTLDVSDAAGSSSVRLRIASTSTSSSVGVGIKTIVLTGTESAGDGSLISSTTVADTEYTFTGLTPETTYYARVKGESDWSDVKEFTTLPAGDSAPVWSALPSNATAYVGELYELTLTDYVTASPAATITLVSATADGAAYASYEYDGSTLVFSPDAMVDYVFNFSAANGVGSAATASLTVTGVADPATLSISSAAVSATVGELCTFDATFGGRPTPTFSLTSDYPDSTLYSVSTNGVFEFIPESIGEYSFTLTAANIAATVSQQFTVTVSEAPVTVPTLTITDITDTSALATWTACDGVSSYTLQLSTNAFPAAGSSARGTSSVLSENFSNVTTSNSTAIANFDNVMSTSGWSGTYVYPNLGMVKIGKSSSGQGWIQTPALTVSTSVTVEWSAYRYASTDSGTLLLGISEDGGTTFTEVEAELTDSMASYSKTFAVSGSSAIIRWKGASASKARFYLDDIAITTGSSGGGDDPGGDGIETFTVSGTTYTFTDLTPETTYYARVKGTSDWSNVETFTTLAGADSAPVWSAIPAQNYLFGSNNGTFEFNVAAYASGSPAPAFYLVDTPWTAYVDDGNGDFIFEPEALGTFDFTVIASNTLGTANATLSVTVTAAPPAFVDLPSTVTGYAGEDVAFTVVATGNPAPVLDVDAADGLLFDFNPTTGLFEFNSDNTGDFEFEFTAANIAATVTQTVTVTISPAPVTVPVLTVTNVTDTTALATWTACDGVTEYTLQLTDDEFPAASGASRSATPILSENFDKFTTVEGSADISGSLDEYTTSSGWTGSKVYTDGGRAKVGASSAQGWIMTPELAASGSLVVVWSGAHYSSSTEKTTLLLGISENGTDFDEETITIGDEMTGYTNTFTVTGPTVYVRWMGSGSSKARFYLDDVSITNPGGGGSGGDDPAGDSVQEFTVTGTTYEFTGLTPATVYAARVKGNAGWSEEVLFETLGSAGTAPSIEAIADRTMALADIADEFTVTATGDPAPTFSVSSSDAPAGSFTIGENNGEFSFMPETVGTFHFTVTAANGVSPDATASFAVTVTGEAPAVTVTPATYSYEVSVGDPYVEFTVTASGYPVPTLSDSCTEGAYYIFENNAFLFDPDTAGTYHFVFTASNSEGEDSKTVTVTVSGGEPPLTAFQQWLADNGYGEHAEGEIAGNGQTYFENYIADIDPSTTNELALVFSDGQFIVDNASENRWYQFIYSTNLKDGFANTNALGKPDALPLVIVPPDAANWFGRIKVTVDEPTAP